MNIYCIMKDNNLKRVSLSQDLQTRLKDYIYERIQSFINSEQIQFTGEYKPEEGQILCIKDFENPFEDFSAPTIEILNVEDIDSIKTIVFKDDNYVAYQSFDKRKIIKPEKWFIIFTRDTFSKIENKGLIIEQRIDALYVIKERKLLFFSYHNASKVFNISNYFREATDEEVRSFYSNEVFSTVEDISEDMFNTRIRKKIYLIQKNEVLEKVKKNFDIVYEYSRNIGLENMFDKENKKINFPQDKKSLERLIKFLNDDLFISPVTGILYETNSKKPIQ